MKDEHTQAAASPSAAETDTANLGCQDGQYPR